MSEQPSLPGDARPAAALEDVQAVQERILEGVSRTFALTIPSLPQPLRIAVTNAYLLCRIADTIEDDPDLEPARKQDLGDDFLKVLDGEIHPDEFVGKLLPRLSERINPAERELIRQTGSVVAVTRALPPEQHRALLRCVRVMSEGMHRYQQSAGLHGLRDRSQLDEYCYCVAGVVGEILTELFCNHSPEIARNRAGMMRLAPAFGQGLQMTNILKDIWEDRRRGACWLPRTEFPACADRPADLLGEVSGEQLEAGLKRLVAVAHRNLRAALEYTLLIPPHEKGIRRFCLWALGMAVLTLRKINRHPDFRAGDQVKISRRSVAMVVGLSGRFCARDRLLRALFGLASAGLPLDGAATRGRHLESRT